MKILPALVGLRLLSSDSTPGSSIQASFRRGGSLEKTAQDLSLAGWRSAFRPRTTECETELVVALQRSGEGFDGSVVAQNNLVRLERAMGGGQ